MKTKTKYVLVSSGPALSGGSVRCVLRELGGEKTINVTFATFERMKKERRIEPRAFVPKERR